MKSMLREASSITKAIEKAWIESGKPAEFTIKILEKGEKNFLGMSKRPAIVSITYGPIFGSDRQRNKSFTQVRSFNKPQASNVNQGVIENRDKQQLQKVAVKEDSKRYDSSLRNTGTQTQKREVLVDKAIQADREIISWNAEMADYCTDNLKEILSVLRIESFFIAKINNKNLVIIFDKNIATAVAEDLKSFFASVAHILMQLLKRKYKKRFKGIQIIINHTASNDTSNSTSN
ncbi:MAG: hypothetical protein US49_C0001G0099 [candidate division TM6 bacterium GW2011_GWF2_37_49]|nr:MAG: hypothetical protein US49_C0001G0099 [candidate division TM6 bacterium GW2011_GWF2_37_49]